VQVSRSAYRPDGPRETTVTVTLDGY
jgi:hypothetical protein